MFLAACFSLEIGNAFLEAGVPHVICSSRAIDCVSVQVFTQIFYSYIFTEQKCICIAYREAIEQMKIHKNDQVRKEWPKYKLMSKCKGGCTRLIEIKHFTAKPKDIEEVLAFRISRPLQEILEQKEELDAVH